MEMMQYKFNFLKVVDHSANVVCRGPSIYKLKPKILQKSTYFNKSTFKSVEN